MKRQVFIEQIWRIEKIEKNAIQVYVLLHHSTLISTANKKVRTG